MLFHAWILSLMVSLQPPAQTPWADTYPATAAAIEHVVEDEAPLFKDDDDRHKTAALLVSLAWFESRFQPDAAGDHGQSLGLFQISKSHASPEALSDASFATRKAIELIRDSQRVCKGRPADEMLGWYASGGSTCGGTRASRHRVNLAMRLARKGDT